uniref:Uncharacterized protein n=1 Tax=Brassica campestris TaxID=3711 RepID=M4EI18_BRACM
MGLSCSSEQVVEELPTHDPDKDDIRKKPTWFTVRVWSAILWTTVCVDLTRRDPLEDELAANIRCFSDLHHRHTSRSQFQQGSTCDALLGILSQLNFGGQALTLPDRLVPSLRASSSFTTYATETLHYLSVFVAFKE